VSDFKVGDKVRLTAAYIASHDMANSEVAEVLSTDMAGYPGLILVGWHHDKCTQTVLPEWLEMEGMAEQKARKETAHDVRIKVDADGWLSINQADRSFEAGPHAGAYIGREVARLYRERKWDVVTAGAAQQVASKRPAFALDRKPFVAWEMRNEAEEWEALCRPKRHEMPDLRVGYRVTHEGRQGECVAINEELATVAICWDGEHGWTWMPEEVLAKSVQVTPFGRDAAFKSGDRVEHIRGGGRGVVFSDWNGAGRVRVTWDGSHGPQLVSAEGLRRLPPEEPVRAAGAGKPDGDPVGGGSASAQVPSMANLVARIETLEAIVRRMGGAS